MASVAHPREGHRYPIFGTRFLPDGTVLDADPIGRLLQPRPTAVSGRLVTTDSSFLLVWQDTRNTPPMSNRSIFAQRLPTLIASPSLPCR